MNNKSKALDSAELVTLKASPGDVVLSSMALPSPDGIVSGTSGRKNESYEPYLDLVSVRRLLEFLEHVVLSERLILQVPSYSHASSNFITGKRTWIDFAVFEAVGDLAYTTDQLRDRLLQAGILFPAKLDVGHSTADDLVSALLPNSKWMRQRRAEYAEFAETSVKYQKKQPAYVDANMAKHIGAPLHVLDAAGSFGFPFIQSNYEIEAIAGFEREVLRTRKSVTQVLLDRLNGGVRKEIERLAEVAPVSVFPETPIARMIVNEAKTPEGLVEAALALRSQFADFRKAMGQLQSDLQSDTLSLSARLKKHRELERLADSLWREQRTDLRTNAQAVTETLIAIPEVVAAPSIKSVGELANKLIALPVERLIGLYRHRKVRLLQKAKRSFLQGNDATAQLAKIFGVSEAVVRSSAQYGRRLKADFVRANPEWIEIQARLDARKRST